MKVMQAPFSFGVSSKLVSYVNRNKYECLLLSFMLLIFGNTFSTSYPLFGIMDIYQNFITGFFIFYNKKWLRFFIAAIILFTVLLDVFSRELYFMDLRSWHGDLYLIFFFLVAKEVYKQVFYVKVVTRELLAAALCGFVLLCLIATFLFYQIDIKLPHSFSNTGDEKSILINLNYFSFTTLLTIGYGDITPMSLIAKRAVMLMGFAGHFYTVFITSIIIGRYLSNKNSDTTF